MCSSVPAVENHGGRRTRSADHISPSNLMDDLSPKFTGKSKRGQQSVGRPWPPSMGAEPKAYNYHTIPFFKYTFYFLVNTILMCK